MRRVPIDGRRRHRAAARARRRPPRQRGLGPARRARRAARCASGRSPRGGGIILAGRDIGTVVLPDADLEAVPRGLGRRARPAARRRARPGARFAGGPTHPGRPAASRPPRQQPRRWRRCASPTMLSSCAPTGATFEDTVAEVVDIIRDTGRAGDRHRMSDHQAMTLYPTLHRRAVPLRPAVDRPGPRRGPRGPAAAGPAHHRRQPHEQRRPALHRRLARARPWGAGPRSWPRSRCSMARWASSSARSVPSRSRPVATTSAPIAWPRASSTRAAWWPSCPRARARSMASWAQPKPGVSLLATRTGTPVLPVGISGTEHAHRPRAGPAQDRHAHHPARRAPLPR